MQESAPLTLPVFQHRDRYTAMPDSYQMQTDTPRSLTAETAAAAEGPTGRRLAQKPAQLARQQQGAGDWRAPAELHCELETTAERPTTAPYPSQGKGAGGARTKGARACRNTGRRTRSGRGGGAAGGEGAEATRSR